MRSRPSSFNLHYLLVSLDITSSCLRPLHRLPVPLYPSFNNRFQKAISMQDVTKLFSFSFLPCSIICKRTYLRRSGQKEKSLIFDCMSHTYCSPQQVLTPKKTNTVAYHKIQCETQQCTTKNGSWLLTGHSSHVPTPVQ
jgi:hypothetical protein